MEVQLYFGIISIVACLKYCDSLESPTSNARVSAQESQPSYTEIVAQFKIPSRLWFPNFISGVRASENASDLVKDNFSYWQCVRRCAKRTGCVALSYHAGLKVCVTSMQPGFVEEEAVGYVLSKKSTWNEATYRWCEDNCEEPGRTCQRSGKCGKDFCPVPVAPDNGEVLGNIRTFRKTIAYTCDRGFDLTNGDARRTCRGGNWNGTLPSCEALSSASQGQQTPVNSGSSTSDSSGGDSSHD